jgi:hypothetical protein
LPHLFQPIRHFVIDTRSIETFPVKCSRPFLHLPASFFVFNQMIEGFSKFSSIASRVEDTSAGILQDRRQLTRQRIYDRQAVRQIFDRLVGDRLKSPRPIGGQSDR